jgi:hypothetical protein
MATPCHTPMPGVSTESVLQLHLKLRTRIMAAPKLIVCSPESEAFLHRHYDTECFKNGIKFVQREVFKGVEDSRRPPALLCRKVISGVARLQGIEMSASQARVKL